jgi:hypothetical protein
MRQTEITLRAAQRFLCAASCALAAAVAGAAPDAHTQEDIARHKQIAAAHEAAAQCLQSGAKAADCAAKLKAACKGIAVGSHCGLRTGAGDYKDPGKHVAEHLTMVKAHGNAAACLAEGKPHGECQKALAQDCGGVGVGKYCGMRH